MIETSHVERYTIPLGGSMSLNEGTTVGQLIAVLGKLPAAGIVSTAFDGHQIYVTYENDPIRT